MILQNIHHIHMTYDIALFLIRRCRWRDENLSGRWNDDYNLRTHPPAQGILATNWNTISSFQLGTEVLLDDVIIKRIIETVRPWCTPFYHFTMPVKDSLKKYKAWKHKDRARSIILVLKYVMTCLQTRLVKIPDNWEQTCSKKYKSQQLKLNKKSSRIIRLLADTSIMECRKCDYTSLIYCIHLHYTPARVRW